MLAKRRPLGGGLHVLEAVDEVERDRIEQRELLLHGDREVGSGVEGLASRPDELVRRQSLRVAH